MFYKYMMFSLTFHISLILTSALLFAAQAWENMFNASASSPNPNNPAEYCSTIPPLQQAQASGALSSPPPTVMVPVGVLKYPGTEGNTNFVQKCSAIPKQEIDFTH